MVNIMSNERNYGIDLLRLVLMYMVCMLHTLGHGGILNACRAGSLEYKIFFMIEILCYCAVDAFAIISGYVAIDKPRKYEKIVEMWFQVVFYSFFVTLVLTIIGINKEWRLIDFIVALFPVTFRKFWYFTAYFALFFTIPILNRFVFSIDEEIAKKKFIGLILIFSILGTANDPFESNGGYSAIWLMVLYCLGALAKKIKLFETKKAFTLILMWSGCVLVTWVVRVYTGIGRLMYYISPTTLLSGMIMVVLFARVRIKGSYIRKISPLAFGIYLFQLNSVIWNHVLKDAFVFVLKSNLLIAFFEVILLAAIIFISGLAVEAIRGRLAKAIGIPQISAFIVEKIGGVINHLLVFLK